MPFCKQAAWISSCSLAHSSSLLSQGLISLPFTLEKRHFIPPKACITQASVLLVSKPPAHSFHPLSLVWNYNSRDVFPKFKEERFIAGSQDCKAQHFPSPPITLAIPGEQYPVAWALATSTCLFIHQRMVPYVKGEGPESRNTTSLGVVPQAETQQLLSPTHISMVHRVFSVLTLPLTNSGSVSPPNTFSRHQATTQCREVLGFPMHSSPTSTGWPVASHSKV